LIIRRALAKLRFRGSWRLRQSLAHDLLTRWLPSQGVICRTNYDFWLIVNPPMDSYQRNRRYFLRISRSAANSRCEHPL
jgi:hypothetical protein